MKSTRPPMPTALSTVSTTVEWVGPEYAQYVLDNLNTHNRTFKRTIIRQVAHALNNDEFQFTGQTIIFGVDGQLIDGQNRLAAIVQSGIGTWINVCRGVPNEAFQAMDLGARRTPADMLGLSGVASSAVKAAAARYVIAWRYGLPYTQASNNQLTAAIFEIRNEIMGQKDDLYEFFAGICGRVSKNCALKPAPVLGFAVIVAETHGIDVITAFLDGLGSGVGLRPGDARLALRNWAVVTGSKELSAVHYAALVKCFEAWVTERPLSKIMPLGRSGSYPQLDAA